jgi:hypothetical protein
MRGHRRVRARPSVPHPGPDRLGDEARAERSPEESWQAVDELLHWRDHQAVDDDGAAGARPELASRRGEPRTCAVMPDALGAGLDGVDAIRAVTSP